jgi:hypothetical protein
VTGTRPAGRTGRFGSRPLELVLAIAPAVSVTVVTRVYLIAPERSWLVTERPMTHVREKVPAPLTVRLAEHSVCFLPPRRTALWVIVPAWLTATELLSVIVDLPVVRVVFFTVTAGPTAGAGAPATENAALTLVGALTCSLHEGEVPAHASPHPANADPAAGAALRVTLEPMGK